jgi:hypothetical protein
MCRPILTGPTIEVSWDILPRGRGVVAEVGAASPNSGRDPVSVKPTRGHGRVGQRGLDLLISHIYIRICTDKPPTPEGPARPFHSLSGYVGKAVFH